MSSIILYSNIIIGSTLTVTNTASGYSINNIIDYKSYTKWKSNTTDDQTIQAVLGTAAPADCIGIFNHNLSGTTITVKYDVSGTMTTAATISPTSNNPILVKFTSRTTDTWQIIISGLSAAAEAAVIFLGACITFPFLPRAPYIPRDEGIEVVSEVSQAGHLLGSVVAHYPVSINPVWELLLRTWFNTYLAPFWDDHAKLLKPFFFGWDLTNRPNDIFYCWVDPGMRFKEILTTLNYSDEFSLLLKSVNTQ